jgi:hypothetical protein
MGYFILPRPLRKGLLVALITTLAAWSAPSYAGGHHVLIDFGFDTGTNNANGEAWVFSSAQCIPSLPPPVTPPGFASCVLDFSSATAIANSTAAVPLGFNVKIGSTTYSSVHPSEFGVLTFATALTSFTPAADFDALTTLLGTANPFIAAFYPSEAFVIPTATDPEGIQNGGAEYGRGEANPSGTDGGDNTILTGDVAAFKATWFDNADGSIPNPVATRIVIYNRASGGADGDFDLRIEYGGTYNDGSGKNGLVGFRLGSDTNKVVVSSSIAAPTVVTDTTTDYYYQFRNGQLVGSVTQVIVPNVVNATQAAATTAIQTAALVLGTVTTQSSSTVALGRVISQNPVSGASVASGSAVSLVVSSGVPVIRGDINRDGQVDVLDLALVLEAFNKHVGPNDPRDLNRDGIVNLRDAVILVQLCTHPLCARKGH